MKYRILAFIFIEPIFVHFADALPPTVMFPDNQTTISNPILSPTSPGSNIPMLNTVLNTTVVRKNEWWPPSDTEVMQTSPYSTEVHQSMPPAYYLPEPISPTLAYRSEPWTPYGYPEIGYPLIGQNPNNQLGMSSKFMTVALFIGLLTLFAIIQGSMVAAKRKDDLVDALSSRKKRDLSFEIDSMTPEQEEILNTDSKVRCIQRTICLENRELMTDFGHRGIKVAKYLTRSVKKTLKHISGWDRLVQDAAAAGLRGDDCNIIYRDCVLPVDKPH
ncbi:uncharacterized protein LOC103575503 [Microplitis demolitor]|uniref:uncharacterized protein LOC103575503 n=1 Tax=Microplitis demolitor TaxID=69319 RepID=UPI0004CD48DB|nr:uncharacterized protein LOC103575503 [Microplitis demolitor]